MSMVVAHALRLVDFIPSTLDTTNSNGLIEIGRIMFVKPGRVSQTKGFIVAHEERCSGCRACEAICSLFHEEVVRPQLSRIEVRTWPFEGYRSEVYTCQQCKDPKCLPVCPTGALYRDEVTEAVIIEKKNCTGCKLCMESCSRIPPRIRYDAGKNVCIKCDLCGGNPLCVEYCMEGALSLERV
jgi:anaerobic carbon-monoxide dehydrogenase iron sulfur subunit